MGKVKPYHENLLHWIWGNRHFKLTGLSTQDGRPLQIYDVGTLNPSDGPDFQHACLQIGNLRWHGDIEIHWEAQDWNRHQHQHDANFNNVVLHVVYHQTQKPEITRKDGTKIPVLVLEPLLQKSLRTFLQQSKKTSKLPCAGQFSYISKQAFVQQLEKAHKEYFEQKVTDLMRFYNPSLPVSTAWQNMTITALFDGLGISQNREPMQQLCIKILKLLPSAASLSQFIDQAIAVSGVNDEAALQKYNWKHKGSRPNNHPKVRIKQGAVLLWYFKNESIKTFLKSDIETQWNQLNAQAAPSYPVGEERKNILFGTVWLPALFSLGNLLHSKPLKSQAWQKWKEHRVRLPESLIMPFNSLPVAKENYRDKLGSIHQLRSYCKPRKCEACKVFKSVISA